MQTHEQYLEYQREYQQRNRAKRTEYRRKYRATLKGKEATERTNKSYQQANPEKVSAWRKASYRIASKPCEVCGNPITDRHHDDYDQPLQVRHLCRIHHKQLHVATIGISKHKD